MAEPNGTEDVDRGAPADRLGEWGGDAAGAASDPTPVSARDSDADLLSAFEHEGCRCELGVADDTLYGFLRLPERVDQLNLLWELDPPGEFVYGPDAAGWVGFTPPTDDASPREVGVALAGLAAQVADRGRDPPE